MDYKIAIPSYNRETTIREKTINYLLECNIDMNNVYIFVANEEQMDKYNYLKELGLNIVLGVKGISRQRNFIRDYFDNGDFIFSIDDDISYLSKLNGDKLIKVNKLNDLVKNCFDICVKNKTKLWGVTAVNNSFYMKDNITTNLKFIVGCFYGFINDKSKNFYAPDIVSGKEDYYLTLETYIKYNKIIRLNGYSPVTKYYTEPGGLQDQRDTKSSEEAALYLLGRYPNYVKIKGLSKNGHMEILIKDNNK